MQRLFDNTQFPVNLGCLFANQKLSNHGQLEFDGVVSL